MEDQRRYQTSCTEKTATPGTIALARAATSSWVLACGIRPSCQRLIKKTAPVERTRIDRWLWAIRLCKTRAEATNACRGGHVQVNGRAAKPATAVAVGDRVEGRLHGRARVVEVTRVIDTRVGAPIAVECYVDHSPPPERDPAIADRDRGTGRPTKRERRQLDRWRTGRG